MTTDEAMNIVENPEDAGNKTYLFCAYVPAAKTLASAVRELRAENGKLRDLVARGRGYVREALEKPPTLDDDFAEEWLQDARQALEHSAP